MVRSGDEAMQEGFGAHVRTVQNLTYRYCMPSRHCRETGYADTGMFQPCGRTMVAPDLLPAEALIAHDARLRWTAVKERMVPRCGCEECSRG